MDAKNHVVPGELLIKFRPGAALKSTAIMRQKAHSKTHFKTFGIERWKLSSSSDINALIKQLKTDPAVEIVEPNYRRYPRSSHSFAIAEASARLDQVRLTELWEQPVTRVDNVRIAVIDDAFHTDHEDLGGNIALSFDAVDNDSDVRPPETCLLDDGTAQGEHHGTEVLGILGAVRGNDIGIDGASDNADIYPIRIGCNYSVAEELAAVEWAIQNEVDIISISYGGPMYSELERMAFQEALGNEIMVVTAAGNDHMDNDRVADYPSGLDLPNILAVAATNADNQLAEWSQWGQTTADIAAPGEDIATTSFLTNYPVGRRGTSYSAPMVAGIIASLMARDPFPNVSFGPVFRAHAALLASAQELQNTPKARLATDGYVDAMAAYQMLDALQPVIVIKSITVDDSEFGNNNGVLDTDELVTLRIVLENKGVDTTELQARLSTSDIPSLGEQINGNIGGFNLDTYSYGQLELDYQVDFSGVSPKQDILFALDLSGTYLFGTESFNYARYFTLDLGTLTAGDTVTGNKMRLNGDNQDELHHYHIDVPSGSKNLVVTLSTINSTDNTQTLDLLGAHGGTPQFTYVDSFYELGGININSGVHVGKADGDFNSKRIVISEPEQGTYHFVALVPDGNTQVGIEYSIKAEFKSGESPRSGCSIGTNNPFDPGLLLLVAIAILRLSRSHNKTLN